MIRSSISDWFDRRAGRLHDEAVHAADVLADLDVDLAVGEVGHVGPAQRDLDELAHLLGQRPVRIPREDRERFQHDDLRREWWPFASTAPNVELTISGPCSANACQFYMEGPTTVTFTFTPR
jgi:hypothetical protein